MTFAERIAARQPPEGGEGARCKECGWQVRATHAAACSLDGEIYGFECAQVDVDDEQAVSQLELDA